MDFPRGRACMLEILRKAFTEEDFRDFEMFLGFCGEIKITDEG